IVEELSLAPDNGRITRLSVPRGNVVLNLRRFTHRGSELEIETPSGVSGVRGTDFGIIVHPEDQRTSVATETGAVFAAAEGVTVDVPNGFQTLIRMGDPPIEPQPIPAEPLFEYRIESAVRDYVRYLVLVGQIDPINQLYVADELQDVTETGEFRYEDFAYHGATVQVSIVTPLGDVTTYDVSLL
ncbi:MAG: FecR domain-containing protein, partial [Cyanobacteria bacterium P01_C01_bin.147]